MRSFVVHNDCYKFSGLNVSRNNNSSYDREANNQESCEKFLMTYYFSCGFSYKQILLFLDAHHNNVISYRTLLRRLEQYGLYQRGKNINHDNLRLAYQKIEEIVNGPGVSGGYRTVWHTMEMEGIRIPRKFVQNVFKGDSSGRVRPSSSIIA